MTQKVANSPLGSFLVHDDTITASGAKAQLIKIDKGAAGLSSPVTDANPLPVSATIAAGGVVSTKTALTPSAPTAATIAATSTVAVAANANRKGLILINTSNNTMSLSFGAVPAVLNSGVTLYPGGTYSMGEYDYNLGEVRAIASAGSSNLAIQEFS